MPSPGAYKKEVDLSLYVETESDFIAGLVHTFSKGPIGERTLITNLPALEATFGKPIDDDVHCQGFFGAREYLRSGNQIHIVREDSAANPAGYGVAGIQGGTEETLASAADGATSIPATRTLTSATGDFITDGVLVGDVVELQSGADVGFYVIATVAATILTVDRDWSTGSEAALSFTVWSGKDAGAADGVTSAPATRQLTSASSTFQSSGVAVGDMLHINDTGDTDDNGFYTVASVVSETVLLLNRDFSLGGLATLTFSVYGQSHPDTGDGSTAVAGEFLAATAQFELHGVRVGDLLVIEDTSTDGDNGTYVITGLKTGAEATTLEVFEDVWPAGSLTSLTYRVIPGILTLTPESKGTWADGYMIAVSQNPFVPAQYDVTMADENGVTVESISGMTNATIVASFLSDSVYFPTVVVQSSRIGPALDSSGIAAGGDNGTTGIVDADLIGTTGSGLQLFRNVEEVEVDMLSITAYSSQAIGDALINMAESTRGDCMALIDSPDSPTVASPSDVVDWHNGTGGFGRTSALNSSFAALYWSWQETYDPYHDKYRYIAPSAHLMNVYAQSQNATKAWFAPAGLRRGKVKGASNVRYSPDQGERDYMLVNNNVNPIVNFVKEGIHVYGQKTLYRTNSALNRVATRRMLLALERPVLAALKSVTFEPNDTATDREIVNLVTPIFEYVRDNRGMTEFLIVVDDTTSPPEVRQQNKIIGKGFIKPTPTAEVIEFQFTLTAQTVDFSALIAS